MLSPTPRQPEPMFWYQVGCMIGCTCSGGGKEMYPTPQSVGCSDPLEPTLKTSDRTWNVRAESPRGDWNRYAPWRAPGTALPLDSCGIASGFLPTAAVQYPHKFEPSLNVKQGDLGSELPKGNVTEWEAGAVVEASFTLIVNHGGGYQYRVCPAGNAVDETCFAANVLAFADNKHTVRFKSGAPVELNALDVSEGVAPAGSTWRRLPIPACNCDIGEGCEAASTDAADAGKASPNQVAYNQGKRVGHCATGLQFEAEHLAKVWPDGYGYYTENLGSQKYDYGKKTEATGTGKSGKCSGSTTEEKCKGIADCIWHETKKECYHKNANRCGKLKTQEKCESFARCAWASSPKNVCYMPTSKDETSASGDKAYSKEKTAGTAPMDFSGMQAAADADGKTFDWWIVDKLRAPKEPGEYILQWRWDNEQTPQIWTTCADIKVVAPTPAPRSSIGVPASAPPPSSGAREAGAPYATLPAALAIAALVL